MARAKLRASRQSFGASVDDLAQTLARETVSVERQQSPRTSGLASLLRNEAPPPPSREEAVRLKGLHSQKRFEWYRNMSPDIVHAMKPDAVPPAVVSPRPQSARATPEIKHRARNMNS